MLLLSQRRNLIHASAEMISRVFIKPTRIWLVGAVSDELSVNCGLPCVCVCSGFPNETPLEVLEHFQKISLIPKCQLVKNHFSTDALEVKLAGTAVHGSLSSNLKANCSALFKALNPLIFRFFSLF